jgi:leader peptidase (prepilin peptidase)/N-methyltransferase
MLYIFVFVLGSIMGSFLNVCIYRIPRKETVVYNSSHCIKCSHKLAVKDLIPVFSYIFLKGRCRYCGKKIPIRYFLVELITAFSMLLLFYKYGLNLEFLKYSVIILTLIVIAFIDLEHQIIPNRLVLFIFIWAVLWHVFIPKISWINSLLGALLGGGLLFVLAVVSRGGMGGGDIKLMFAAGFFLGLKNTVLALFIGFLSGAVIGVGLIFLSIKNRREPIAFGPFLSLGIITALIWGENIIKIYSKIVGF